MDIHYINIKLPKYLGDRLKKQALDKRLSLKGYASMILENAAMGVRDVTQVTRPYSEEKVDHEKVDRD